MSTSFDERLGRVVRKDRGYFLAMGLLALLLDCTGCAQTKSVAPIQISQPGDERLSCKQINDEIYTTQVTAINFADQAAKVEGNNTAFKVGTIFTTWAALGIDLSKEDQIKWRSLEDRNQHLLYLKAEKKC